VFVGVPAGIALALLIEMKRRGMRPDFISLADVGAEKRGTYRFIPYMIEWCRDADFPEPTICVYEPKDETTARYRNATIDVLERLGVAVTEQAASAAIPHLRQHGCQLHAAGHCLRDEVLFHQMEARSPRAHMNPTSGISPRLGIRPEGSEVHRLRRHRGPSHVRRRQGDQDLPRARTAGVRRALPSGIPAAGMGA
jgi:hypothetical protein